MSVVAGSVCTALLLDVAIRKFLRPHGSCSIYFNFNGQSGRNLQIYLIRRICMIVLGSEFPLQKNVVFNPETGVITYVSLGAP